MLRALRLSMDKSVRCIFKIKRRMNNKKKNLSNHPLYDELKVASCINISNLHIIHIHKNTTDRKTCFVLHGYKTFSASIRNKILSISAGMSYFSQF